MCRLLGVVASESTEFRFSLAEAPRSLSFLSSEHPHGWGLAVHRRGEGWRHHRHAVRAGDCPLFQRVAASAQGEVLVAHIRKRTVGPVGPLNTHPFRRGRWVFAHNGTIDDVGWLERETSSARASEIEGETDSERFFAWVLTRLDEASVTEGAAVERVDEVLRRCVGRALDQPRLGAANFLLSCGENMWAFRKGRTLHVLERAWTKRRQAVLVASEATTAGPWREVP